MKAVTLRVSGMRCGHCVRAVEDALKGVSGAKVEGVQIGQATVAIEESVSVGALIDAVSDAGYDAEEVQPA
jgi:copper chaperone CopZ